MNPVIWPLLATLILTTATIRWLRAQARDWDNSRARIWWLWAQVEYRRLFIPNRPRNGRTHITRLTGVAQLDHADPNPATVVLAYRSGDPYAIRLAISSADTTRTHTLARDLINTALRDGHAGQPPLTLTIEDTGMLHIEAETPTGHTDLWIPGLPLLRATIAWERIVPTGRERTDVDTALIQLLDPRYHG